MCNLTNSIILIVVKLFFLPIFISFGMLENQDRQGNEEYYRPRGFFYSGI